MEQISSIPILASTSSPPAARRLHAHGQAQAGGPWGERPRVRRQRTRMQGEAGEGGMGSVPVRMNWIKQIGIPAKADCTLERIKCHDLIVFREGKSLNDQMQPVREKIIGILHRNDVKKASFFGSIVRGEMTEESDVDLLVEFDGKKSLLDIAHLKNELEDAISRRVDVLTYKSLHPRLKVRILAEQVPII